MVDIVQLVERQIVDLVVVGSSPSIHPTKVHKCTFFNYSYWDSNRGSTLVGRTATSCSLRNAKICPLGQFF